MSTNLTAERLRELLRYDPDTGEFFWRVNRNNKVKAGSVAGNIEPDGRVRICIDERRFNAGPLAWLYMTGEWPDGEIDHKDADLSNDSFENLRIASRGQNEANKRPRGELGIKGVVRGYGNKFVSKIGYEGKTHHIGTFATLAEAADAYRVVAECVWGEFTRCY